MKTTRKQLNVLLNGIINLTGNKNLQLEYSAIYGGYRLVNVNPNNGAHYGAFGGNGCEPRLKASEMYNKLHTIIASLEYTNLKTN